MRKLLSACCIVAAAHATSDRAPAQQVVRMPAADVALSARPTVLHTLGAADGRQGETFARVGGVAFDGANNLYVLDRGNSRVAVFDSAGRFRRFIGRRGGGPGEFALPQAITVTRAGEIVVEDVGRRAFSVFGPDGAFRRGVPFAQGFTSAGAKVRAHPTRGVVSIFMELPSGAAPGILGQDQVLWQPLQGAATSLYPARTTASRPGRALPAAREKPVFAPEMHFGVLSNGGLAVANTERYSVKIVSPSGPIYRVLERPIAPRRVTAADRDQETKRREAFARPGGLTLVGNQTAALPSRVLAEVAAELQAVEFASVMPVIQALEVDPAGNLWIQRTGTVPGRGPIDLVTPQGRYLGTLGASRLPDAFGPRGRAAYVEADELGVERVIVVRLPARWR